ncbi:hypothetical protein M9H77_02755 [Catharanthus roseus]|uniref:Uncharacterized protein n=1 Tax=Catharanthus roseus TaxID=4058 RepID=A0ACC0C9G9_CATRO|nr:hypothetical protein M9H77_02755 [Catharanthus roseus]
MVLLVEKFRCLKFPTRLDHPTNDDEALLASLRAFRSDVSKFLTQILVESNPGSEFLSLEWFDKCLDLIPLVHRGFAKLVMDINYPMAKWDSNSADEYLNYSLDFLDLLNKVSSSLSHLGQSKLSLAHGLSLFENSPALASKYFEPIRPKDLGKDLKLNGRKRDEENHGSGKEFIIREGFLIMRATGILLLGFLISGLCSSGNPFLELRNSVGKLVDPSLKHLESILSREISENGFIVKEVKEVNSAVASLVDHGAHDSAKELRRRVDVLERLIKNLGKKTDDLFSGILAARDKLLGTIRHNQKE